MSDEELLNMDGDPIDVSMLKPHFDPSKRLNIGVHEKFAQNVARVVNAKRTLNRTQCYQDAIPHEVKRTSAASQAVTLTRRADVALRIRHLTNISDSGNSADVESDDEVVIDVTQLTSKDGIIETLMTMVAAGGLQRGSDVIKTLLELYKMQGFDGEQKAKDWIDPSHVLAWEASVEMNGMTVPQALEAQESFEQLVRVMAKLLGLRRILAQRDDSSVAYSAHNAHKSAQIQRITVRECCEQVLSETSASDYESERSARDVTGGGGDGGEGSGVGGGGGEGDGGMDPHDAPRTTHDAPHPPRAASKIALATNIDSEPHQVSDNPDESDVV